MTLNEYIDNLRGKRVAVVGIGVSNTPLIECLLAGGCSVTACDRRTREQLGEAAARLESMGAVLRLGPDYLRDLDFDVIFRTPGVHPYKPELMAARERGCIITSEMEAFFSLCPCRTIAVTGSDGKTTTCSIIAELLKAEGYKVHLGGNIGKPLLTEIPNIAPEDIVVLELSSFQLHSMKCRPNVAVITNISPNHLDVHPDFEDYVNAKKRIFLEQEDDNTLVLNLDNNITAGFAGESRAKVRFFSRRESMENGVFSRDGMIYLSRYYQVSSIIPETEILLPGVHNIENYMAAFAATEGLVSTRVCRRVARTYGGVAHRLEVIRKLRGVTYCNDSIATSPTRTIAGLRSFTTKPILIVGGYDKNIPFDELAREIVRRVKALILTGDTAQKIKAAVEADLEYDPYKLPITVLDDFREAVLAAHRAAEEGDIVLLSPACSSFDKFRNFAHRGDVFREIVRGLE